MSRSAHYLDPVQLQLDNLRMHIADTIERLVVGDGLQASHRLPSLADISQQFGVGRTITRDALLLLEGGGLIELRPRSGPHVASATPDLISDAIRRYALLGTYSKEDLLLLRTTLEPEAAALAAEQAASDDLERLKMHAEGIEDAFSCGDIERYEEHDEGFHLEVALACTNPLFYAILDGLRPAIRNLWRNATERPGSRGVHNHLDVYHAIEARDPSWARSAMRSHMAAARARLLDSKGSDSQSAGSKFG